MLGEICISEREVVTTEKAAVGRKRRRMRGGEDKVAVAVDKLRLGNGITAPQEKDKMLTLPAEGTDSGIGELFPTVALVAACLVSTNGKS